MQSYQTPLAHAQRMLSSCRFHSPWWCNSTATWYSSTATRYNSTATLYNSTATRRKIAPAPMRDLRAAASNAPRHVRRTLADPSRLCASVSPGPCGSGPARTGSHCTGTHGPALAIKSPRRTALCRAVAMFKAEISTSARLAICIREARRLVRRAAGREPWQAGGGSACLVTARVLHRAGSARGPSYGSTRGGSRCRGLPHRVTEGFALSEFTVGLGYCGAGYWPGDQVGTCALTRTGTATSRARHAT